MPDSAGVGGLGVTDGDGGVWADEQVQLTELDFLALVEVQRRAQDDEEHVAAALELGALVDAQGILGRRAGAG